MTDQNRDQRIKAVRELERLLHVGIDPTFAGTVEVHVQARDGRLGKIKTIVTSHQD